MTMIASEELGSVSAISGLEDSVAHRAPVTKKIQAKIVSTSAELEMANAVRAMVFLGEFGWSYKKAFDDNDFAATHILALSGDEPAGTVRLRWFAEFARIERIAIRREFRSLKMLNTIANTALRLCRKKGYEKVGGIAYPELLPFWARHGALPCGPEMNTDYGCVVPIIGTPRRWDDIRAVSADDAGRWDFEWETVGWEGTGV